MYFLYNFRFLLAFNFLCLISYAVGQDECAELFFTPAWQDCFMKRLQANIIHNSQNQMPLFPNPPQGGDFGSSSFSSSSSSSSTSGGMSSSILSSNGRTWSVQTDGLSVTTSMTGTTGHIKMYIGKPASLNTTKEETQNKLFVNLSYADGSTKWVSVQIDSPTRISELLITRRDEVLYIEGPM